MHLVRAEAPVVPATERVPAVVRVVWHRVVVVRVVAVEMLQVLPLPAADSAAVPDPPTVPALVGAEAAAIGRPRRVHVPAVMVPTDDEVLPAADAAAVADHAVMLGGAEVVVPPASDGEDVTPPVLEVEPLPAADAAAVAHDAVVLVGAVVVPVPHTEHQVSSAPGGRCTVWAVCTVCGPE